MRYVLWIARLLLGAPFVVFGLNTLMWSLGYDPLMEPPQEMPEAAQKFMDAMTDAGFMHPLRGGAELAGGFMVLTGLFLPLGLVVLAPIVVHIVLYHHFLDPSGTIIAYVILALEVFLALAYLSQFRGVLHPWPKSPWNGSGSDPA
ncbi:MAG: DoxX family membrane protein [Planctomycetota bacterium]|nr:MAG: DoxX family membrane protein [Planctomycetota bacterium]